MTQEDRDKRAQEAYNQLKYEFGKHRDFKSEDGMYFWFGVNESNGVMFNAWDCKVKMWRYDKEGDSLDIWSDESGGFVWNEYYTKFYKAKIEEIAEKELLGLYE